MSFPDFSGIFPICLGTLRVFSRFVLFLFLGLLTAPTRNSPERVRKGSATQSGPFPKKSGKPPGLASPKQRYPETGDRSKKALSNPESGFYRTPFLAPKRFERTPVKSHRTPFSGYPFKTFPIPNQSKRLIFMCLLCSLLESVIMLEHMPMVPQAFAVGSLCNGAHSCAAATLHTGHQEISVQWPDKTQAP